MSDPSDPSVGAGGSGEPELVRERKGPVLVVRLNRPHVRNALTSGMLTGLGAALVEAETDPSLRVLVLTGTGDRAFCSGMDLKAFATGRSTAPADPGAMEAFRRLEAGDTRVPVVGAANGSAVGGGLEILLGCDLIVASREARFALPEVKRGLIPGGSGTFVGTRVPLSVAMELVLTGEPLSAARAYDVGLVNAVVEPGEVLEEALRYADQIASNGPLAVTAARVVARLAPYDRAGAAQRLEQVRPGVFGSEDAREGAAAFVERRSPTWRGR